MLITEIEYCVTLFNNSVFHTWHILRDERNETRYWFESDQCSFCLILSSLFFLGKKFQKTILISKLLKVGYLNFFGRYNDNISAEVLCQLLS